MVSILKKLWGNTAGHNGLIYVVGVAAIIYGWYFKDTNAVILGLGLFGVSNKVASEVSKLAK